MSRWFRVYDELLDDPKAQRLHPALFKIMINLWCVASRNDGRLPSASDLSFSLRMSEDETLRAVSKLVDAGFIDTDTTTGEQRPHGWDARQFRSDSSTDRVRAHRKRQKSDDNLDPSPPDDGVQGNGNETLHETPPDTEQIQNRTDSSVTNVTGTVVPHPAASDFCKAVFDGGVNLLTSSGRSERDARSLVGRWRKSLGDAELLILLREAEQKTEPLEWLIAAVETRDGKRTGARDPLLAAYDAACAEERAERSEETDPGAWLALPPASTG